MSKIIEIGNLVKTENWDSPQRGRVYSTSGIAPTLTTKEDSAPKIIKDCDMAKKYRIRKSTPTECFRLMGVREAEIGKIQSAGISDRQQYKMAGNSIVVDVLMGIFKQMFDPEYNNDSPTLF